MPLEVDWRGVYPAVPSQFKEDLSLDIDATKSHIEMLLDNGIHGLVMLGTIGEGTSLSRAEKARAAGIFVRDRIVDGVDHVGAITALATAIPFNDETIRRDIVAFVKARAGGTEADRTAKAGQVETTR